MRVDVYSRKQAEELTPEDGQAIISISVPGKPAAIRRVNEWVDILRLEFHDAQEGEPDLVLFTREMADQIHTFAAAAALTRTNVVVHCDAGISRSVAVGVYFRDVWGYELVLHATSTAFGANNLVLRTLMRHHWENHFNAMRGLDD